MLNVGGTQNAVAARQRGRRRRLPPRLLHRRRRPLQGPLHRGHVRRGPGAAHALPPDEVRGREARPREGPGRLARVPARRSSSATPRPARWTRSTGPTTSSRRCRSSATRCRSGRRWSRSSGAGTNLVPVDYVAAAIDHIAHEEGLDGQAFHIVDPKGIKAGEAMNTFARAGARPARGDAHRQEAHEHAPEGRPELRDADPGAQGRAQVRARRPRDPRRDPRRRRLHREVRRARHQARAAPARASSCRRWSPTPTSCGTTGSATSTRTCSRTARSRAPSTAARWSSRAPRAASAAPPR